jgi:formimidoylglutamate deiminase
MKSIIFKSALLATGWANNVRVDMDENGIITGIEQNVKSPDNLQLGYALPGMNNIHSHAFQRAMAGLAEYSTSPTDSFWTWRDVMYRFAEKVTAGDLLSIASQLYMEMLKAGYISVCEFHYLHHDDEDNMNMSRSILQAAEKAGIALCHLPVLYMTSGFGGSPLGAEQKRFEHSVDDFQNLLQQIKTEMREHPNQRLGMAFHSLRAVPEQALKESLQNIKENPIHIHIAEQNQEVRDCIAHYGKRPVEWLLDNFDVNENWCLVHATHLNDQEIMRLADSGAVAGLCPTTEANLGDGLFPLKQYLEAGGAIAIGSDSHISVSVNEELRLLEYGQRLHYQKRNIATSAHEIHTGTNLYNKCLSGGARASGFDNGSIEVGKRADIIVLDQTSPLLVGTPKENIIDRLIFSGNVSPVKDVYVAGNKMVSDYEHCFEVEIKENFAKTVMRLQKYLD